MDFLIRLFWSVVVIAALIWLGFFLAIDSKPLEVSTDPHKNVTNYSACKKLVARPVEHTVWGDVSTGYDCLD